MATKNSDVYAKQADPKLGNRNSGIRENGGLRFLTATYTMLGTEVAGDKINIGKLPQGCIIDPSHSTVVGDAIATTATLDVGDDDTAGVGAVADVDRYADGLDVAAAGVDRFDSIAAAARLTPYALGADAIIIGTLVTLDTPVAGKKLVFRIGYLAY
jgi:hypothetical protein